MNRPPIQPSPRVTARPGLWRRCLRLLVALAGLVGFADATPALAQGCTYSSAGPTPPTVVVPLSAANLTAGRDAPNGTVLYTSRVLPVSVSFQCVTPFQLNYRYIVTPRAPSPWSGAPFGGATYYETGIPGVAVVVSGDAAVGALPTNTRSAIAPGTYNTTSLMAGGLYVSLVKTGPIAPGVLLGANLPTVQVETNGAPVLALLRISFSGSIGFEAGTCQTPDVMVDLGSHPRSEFTGVGSGTQWKNFSIQLQNCPAFYGNSSTSSPFAGPIPCGQGAQTCTAPLSPNTVGIRLDPATEVVDAAQGLMGTFPEAGGTATGVAIQIGRNGMPVPLQASVDSNLVLAATGGANYSIDLQARYVQIAPMVEPGPANATMMFTIIYK